MVYDDAKELGRRIAAARAYSGLSLEEFSEALGVSAPTVRRWINGEEPSLGRTRAARKLRAGQVAEVTGCPPELFPEEESAEEVSLRNRLDEISRQLDYVVSSLGLLTQQKRPAGAGHSES